MILRKCRGCNQIPDCENECDEDACPIYTSPSFQLPIICCLVVLLLGVLLHLGWNAITRAAEDDAKEIEALGVIGSQLEEAVDLVIQAAIDNSEFPEASYETIHNYSGGINLLIGKYHVRILFHASHRSSVHLPTGADDQTSSCLGNPEGGGEKARCKLEKMRQKKGWSHKSLRHLP